MSRGRPRNKDNFKLSCKKCGGQMLAKDTSYAADYIYRRLFCSNCDYRVSTAEILRDRYDALLESERDLLSLRSLLGAKSS